MSQSVGILHSEYFLVDTVVQMIILGSFIHYSSFFWLNRCELTTETGSLLPKFIGSKEQADLNGTELNWTELK